MSVDPVIDVRELSRKFGSFVAVDRVSFEVAPGEILGYLGANGAGKSTTIRMLCGLLPPSSGHARVAGIDVAQRPEAVKRAIGYMSQKFSLYLDLSAGENLEFFGGTQGLYGKKLKASIQEALRKVGLQEQTRAMVAELPGGWRQRLALACAVLHEPSIVFLDEPTAGVDPLSRRSFWALVRELARAGTTLLVTTHYMDEAEYCDRVGLMVDGRLEALDSPKALKRAFVPGQLFGVRSVPAEARNVLPTLPGVSRVEPFGAGFHVRGPELTLDELARLLAQAGFASASVEKLEASLEDVFLEVVGRGEGPKTSEKVTA